MDYDIFCHVVDNFGDVGVSWRLARQLASDYDMSVRLWVDKPQILARICPDYNPLIERQNVKGVEICFWSTPWCNAEPADRVIEAFGCDLPEEYLEAMAKRDSKPFWINLEYLSAEPWISGFHLRPSPHPRLPLTRFFFFPGFGMDGGGLLKERELEARRDAFMSDYTLQASFLKGLGVHPVAGSMLISIFGYEGAPVSSILDSWAESSKPIHVLLLDGQLLSQASSWYGSNLEPGQTVIRGNLHLSIVGFVSQESYDQILWSCDINFIRGEDSFIRAQWAAKPFVWHIYPQAEHAHEKKLMAFFERYVEGLPCNVIEPLRTLWFDWNRSRAVANSWLQNLSNLELLKLHALRWSEKLGKGHNLTSNLVKFCQNE